MCPVTMDAGAPYIATYNYLGCGLLVTPGAGPSGPESWLVGMGRVGGGNLNHWKLQWAPVPSICLLFANAGLADLSSASPAGPDTGQLFHAWPGLFGIVRNHAVLHKRAAHAGSTRVSTRRDSGYLTGGGASARTRGQPARVEPASARALVSLTRR